MIHHIKSTTLIFLLLSLIVLALGVNLVRFSLLTSVERYKTELEAKIFELTSIPVEIGKLRANMRGFKPELVLKEIQVLPLPTGEKPEIQLQELRLGIDLMQMIYTRTLLPSSWLTLVGVKVSVVRKVDGSLSIVGLNSDDSEQPYWLLSAGRYEVLKSDITWLDQKRNKPPLTFRNVDFLIKNDLDAQTHELHLLSQLPPQIGDSLRVSLSIHGNDLAMDNINADIYVEGKNLHFAEFLGDVPFSGITLEQGESDFKLWTQWKKSELLAVSGQLQVKDAVLSPQGKKQKPLEIALLSGSINALKTAESWQLGIKDFVLKTENQNWASAEVTVAIKKELGQFSGFAKTVNLQQVTQLLQFFSPFEAEKQQLVSKLALKGNVKNLAFFIDEANDSYAINAQFDDVSSQAFANIPQLQNLSGQIKGSDQQGSVRFNTQQGTVFFPQLFSKSIAIKRLSGLLDWHKTEGQWQISSDSMVLNTQDFETESRVAITLPGDNEKAFIDLQTSFGKMLNVSTVADYYPVKVMHKDLLDWLDKAFVSGEIKHGELLFYGSLDKFPFDGGEGVFEVLFDMNNIELHYTPEWPNLKKVDATILILNESLRVDFLNAEVNALKVQRAIVEIPSFDRSQYLLVHGTAKGKIMDSLRFLQKTPLRSSADDILKAITPKGFTKVKFGLKIPLIESVDTVVNGVAFFNNAALQVNSIDLAVTDFSGQLNFTDQGLFGKNIKAETLGYPIEVVVENTSSSTKINVNGKTAVEPLKKQFKSLQQSAFGARMQGTMSYNLNLDISNDEQVPTLFEIKSDLLGLSLDLPGTLKKQSQQKAYFAASLLLNEDKLIPLKLFYKDDFKAAIHFDQEQAALYSAHLVYGNGIAVHSTKSGITVDLDQAIFDLADWMPLLKMDAVNEAPSTVAIRQVNLKTQQLQWGNDQYGPFQVSAQRLQKTWQGRLDCSAAKGTFSVPVDANSQQPISLNMAYLNLSELLQANVQVDTLQAQDLPLVNISSQQLWWNNVDLGTLDVATEAIANGIRFNRVNVKSSKHTIEFEADWIKTQGGSETAIKGRIVADDFGGFLTKLGFDNDIIESRGIIDYDGGWPGTPYQMSLATMQATLDVSLKEGRISSIEPGFGRILGLLAMEQWLKRLSLDFGDLYKQGLSFNSIKGQFSIAQGKANTKNLVVDAVPARVSIQGDVNLVAKTLDQKMHVVPKSSGAVPIAGTIVSSIAGTITQVVTNDYEEGYFFGSNYKITGLWSDVEVTPLPDQDGIFKKTWTGLTDFSWMKSVIE